MMRTLITIVALALMPMSTLAAPLWGAYAEGGEYWAGGEAFGLAWNYPSGKEAAGAAIRLCRDEPQCARHGVHKLRVFSTGANTGADNYTSMMHKGMEGILVRHRCIAIEGLAEDFQAGFGDTEGEAIYDISGGKRDHIEQVACNAR